MTSLNTIYLFVFVFSLISVFGVVFRFIVSLLQSEPKKFEMSGRGTIFFSLFLSYIITYLIQLTGVNTEFIGALPVAIMKPLSGSGARGMMLDIFQTQGADSFVGKLASIFQGSADTTFYIIALYFGSVGIKKIRYALWAGIFADIIGVIIAIFIGYIFFK